MGMMAVDHAHRIVCIGESCKRFLPVPGRAEDDSLLRHRRARC